MGSSRAIRCGMRAVILSASFALAIGCSLMSSLDGLSAGHGTDSEPTDGGASNDAREAMPGARTDASATGFCSGLNPPPHFCVDFDDRLVFRPVTDRNFDQQTTIGPVSRPALDDTSFGTSAPSVRFEAGAEGTTILLRTYASQPSRVVYSLGMRIDSGDAKLDLFEIRLGQNNELNIFMTTEGKALSFNVNSVSHPVGFEIRAGEWHRYEMVVDATPSTFQASVDGVQLLTTSVNVSSVRPGLQIVAGVTWATGPGTVWVDDVIVDF